jgi:type IV pilus assembly protein PilM
MLSPGVENDDKAVALIDIGANKTNINILRGNTSYFTREIYLGGDDFTTAIAKRLGVESHQAELLKRDPGESYEQLRAAVMPAIDDLGNEIHLSFDYFENQFDKEVDEVFLPAAAHGCRCSRRPSRRSSRSGPAPGIRPRT